MSLNFTSEQIIEKTLSRLRPDERLDTEPSSFVPDGFGGDFRIGSTVDYKKTRTVYRLEILGFIRPTTGTPLYRLNRTRCLLSNGRIAHPSILLQINPARMTSAAPAQETVQA